MSSPDAFRIDNLHVRLGLTDILRGLNLRLRAGRIYALIGPSGCGKSTLLKVLAGIHQPLSGSLSYRDAPLRHSGLRIGYVPQNYGLLPWKTVRQNIFLPLSVGPASLRPPTADGADIIRALGLEPVLDQFPRRISGGQQQRAALARAFILRPDLLLMDEPFSALDAFTAAASRELFLQVWQEHRVTTLFITHNMREAAEVGQSILFMGEGRISQSLDNPCFGKPQAEKEQESLLARMAELLHEAVPHV